MNLSRRSASRPFTNSCGVLIGGVIALALGVSSPLALAQIEEIVVTAQKREQSLQDVAMSVTAFSAKELEEYAFDDLRDIASQTPNLMVSSFWGNGKPDIVLRGVGMNNLFTPLDVSPVGVYQDEVLIGSRSGLLSQMFDLERVEVLRGPQGTLLGRNTTGGALHLISRKPDPGGEFNARGAFTYGRFDQMDFDFAVGGPLIKDVLAARVAGMSNDQDGYTDNEFNGDDLHAVDNKAARVMVNWVPTDNMDWLFKAHWSKMKGTGAAYHSEGPGNNGINPFNGYQENPDFHTLSHDQDGVDKIKKWGVSLQGTVELPNLFGGATLTTITSFDKVTYGDAQDIDAMPFEFTHEFFNDEVEQITQELRLTSATDQRFRWVGGFYYYTDEIDGDSLFLINFDPFFDVIPVRDITSGNDFVQDTEAWAVYADFSFDLTDQLTVSGGVRYTDETKDVVIRGFSGLTLDVPIVPAFLAPLVLPVSTVFDFEGTTSADALTGRVALEWKPQDDMLLYARYGRGFKSGGWNGQAAGALVQIQEPFAPEFVNAYEVGAKTQWYDDRLQFNAALFYNDIQDMQSLIIEVLDFFTRNATSADVFGAELEMQSPAHRSVVCLCSDRFTGFGIR